MSKSKSVLVGRYEIVPLEFKDGTSRNKRIFVIQGAMEQMCEFFEAVKDSLENAVNKDVRENGFQDANGADIGHEPADLMDWRTYPKEIDAYATAKADAQRDGLMRFAAEESRFTYDNDPWSWVAALNAAIAATGIEAEPEAMV